MQETRVRRLLEELGYRITTRAGAWTECRVAGDGESWVGSGDEEDLALVDALRHALPSALARRLLDRALAEERGDDVSERTGPPSSDARVQPPAVEAAGFVVPGAMPPPEAPACAAVGAAEWPQAGGATGETRSKAAACAEDRESARSDVQRSGLLPTIGPTTFELLTELRDLRRRIEVDREELALAAPRRQRLVLLGWIARARACQEARDDHDALEDAVQQIARLLGVLARSWWPGSVRALQLASRPAEATADLPPPAPQLLTWTDVAEAADQALLAIEREDELRGYDAYGWSDGDRLSPHPEDPAALLSEIVHALEDLGGPLGTLPHEDALPEPANVLDWARKLRWLRGAVEESERWGTAVGRLRCWISRNRRRFTDADRTLSPEYRPDRSWAAVLGRDVATTRRAAEVQKLLDAAPRPDVPPTDQQIVEWLTLALPLTDTHHAVIAEAMRPFRERVLSLDRDRIPGSDRRIRRRLDKLKNVLANPTGPAPSSPVEEAGAAVRPTPAEAEPGDLYPRELLDRVLVHTRGKRALFVSNRSDPELQRKLEQLLLVEKLEWSAAQPRRLEASADAIAAGAYDLVLGATGFLDHATDGRLRRACQRGNARYVRVNLGRPLACLRALDGMLSRADDTSEHDADAGARDRRARAGSSTR